MPEAPTVFPYIPQSITVHLGPPDSDARNITVSYPAYVKNVASSEIYPTWSESALRANILAISSYALNRVYTEYYRSRGYAFDITSSTAIDQSFVEGRSYFENISQLVDDLFDSYIRRQGFIEPLAAKFCNGTTTTCDGLSQWGSEALAQEGYNSLDILRYYYGENIEIVNGAPVQGIDESYPGTPLRQGSSGPFVTVIQASLNRISQNYPAIPKIDPVDGSFGPETERSVRSFQQIFSLAQDGIVGRATWYQIIQIYVAVQRLAELQSQGQQQYFIGSYPQNLAPGSTGDYVARLQYMLSVLSRFIPSIPPAEETGSFDDATRAAVLAFQQNAGLPATGTVDARTWDAIYEQFSGVEETVFQQEVLFPETEDFSGSTTLQQSPGHTLQPGDRDQGGNL